MINNYPEPIFIPWIGKNYLKMPTKILVVGDSGYCGDSACNGCCGVRGDCSYEDMGDCRNFTGNIIKIYLENRREKNKLEQYEQKTYGGFEKIMFGNFESCIKNSFDECYAFWHSIAFYNFVQTAVADSSDQKNYNNDDYAKSKPMFLHLINLLQPDYIFIWGLRAYHAAPDEGWTDDTNGDSFQGSYKLKSGHVATCASLRHPSRGWLKSSNEKIKKLMGNDYDLFIRSII